MNKLTADRLRHLYSYDADTGLFTRLILISNMGPGPVTGRTDRHGYRSLYIDGQYHLLHRLAWLYVYGEWPNGALDHMDCDKENNRIANLRIADATTNSQNKRGLQRNNTSGCTGVVLVKRAKGTMYQAQIRANGKTSYLGCFETAAEAKSAYLDAKRRLHKGYIHPMTDADKSQAVPVTA